MIRTTTTTTITITLCAALAAGAAGCKDQKKGDGKATTAAKAGKGNAVAYAALTADPEPGAITPSDKPPFESLLFRQRADRDKAGWPSYDLYNLGTKGLKYVAVRGYGYDKDGKQVARSAPALSWNGDIAPGAKSDFAIKLDDWGDKPVPATAVTFQVCFDSIKFDGDADALSEMSRCPEQRPLAK